MSRPPPPLRRTPRLGTPQRWSGYAIRATGDADGGWIGGYRVGRTSLYVVTPTRSPNRAGFETPREVDDLAGRTASRSETQRAAWILSKYGAYRDATQAAAVDATVYHLLVGGKWQLGSARGARRIRQSGDPASVARFARIMLRQSRASAGAYTARLVASSADVGGAVAVTLSVVDGHGRPAAGLPVTLAMSGAAATTSVTGDDGRAVGRFPATVRGWQEVTATVRNVPDHRLHVWPPEKSGQAAAAEGGARRQVVVVAQAPVRGPQTLGLTASPTQPWSARGAGHRHGRRRRCSARRRRLAARALRQRRRRALLWSCGRRGRRPRSRPTATYACPSRARGRRLLRLAGRRRRDRHQHPGRGLRRGREGPGPRERGALGPATAPVSASSRRTVQVSGLALRRSGRRHGQLYGPYAGCRRLHGHPSRRHPRVGRATVTSPPGASMWPEPGWYAWRAEALPDGDLWLGSTLHLRGRRDPHAGPRK